MAVLDRTTRRLIATLKFRVKVLTVLVIILAIGLTTMTVLYIKKGDDKAPAESSSVAKPSSEVAILPSSSIISSDLESGLDSSYTTDLSSQSGSSSSATSSTADTAANATPGSTTSSWNLKLVNGKNPLPNGYTASTTTIKAEYARDYGMLFDSRAVSYLNAMCAAAAKDGINLLVISSHRTNARQTTLFNNQVAKQRNLYPNLSEEALKEKASTISARPGTSEHELGLAVDFNSVEESFENTSQFQWLKAHAAEYGFIMRYSREKQSITGVIYEPWHYRYVGKDHANKINSLGFCLEEYIDYLKKQGK